MTRAARSRSRGLDRDQRGRYEAELFAAVSLAAAERAAARNHARDGDHDIAAAADKRAEAADRDAARIRALLSRFTKPARKPR